ncbi:MAG TPA: hypothetical protein VGD42_17710 [Lysobacter sp.]
MKPPMLPSAGPDPGPAFADADRYVELIAESLREACRCQGDAAFPLIARVIDQHIAGGLQRRRIGRWRNEAMDGLLSLISPAMQARVRAHDEP